jgi:hypothetical protein
MMRVSAALCFLVGVCSSSKENCTEPKKEVIVVNIVFVSLYNRSASAATGAKELSASATSFEQQL